ncbi:MAG: adenosylhomocysteinase [Thermocladium sp.]
MVESKVRDPGLADRGRMQIEWAERNMPVLLLIRERFQREKPLAGLRLSASLHITKETAVLARTLVAGGADVFLAPSNPLSTQDYVAAALATDGIKVYAWKGMNEREYYNAIGAAISHSPQVTLDDGGDLTITLHKLAMDINDDSIRYAKEMIGNIDFKSMVKNIYGGTEETTTGVLRFKAMEREKTLLYPIIAVNDSYTKHLFDNRYGTGQSTWDGVLRATNVLIAGKVVVVSGYGWVGRGIAARARGLGARRVIVTEVDPVRALEAVFDGFEVMPISRAAEEGDIFITATGDMRVINYETILKMKDGAMLANAGHFNVEIDVDAIERNAIRKREIRPFMVEYKLPNGKVIFLLGEGRLVNLVAAEGHPSEVMDLSFANQALASEHIVKNKGRMQPAVYKLPEDLDIEIARLKLKAMGIGIDELTDEQRKYVSAWALGT